MPEPPSESTIEVMHGYLSPLSSPREQVLGGALTAEGAFGQDVSAHPQQGEGFADPLVNHPALPGAPHLTEDGTGPHFAKLRFHRLR